MNRLMILSTALLALATPAFASGKLTVVELKE